MKKSFCLLVFCLSFLISKAQTTDLSIVVAAQNLSGSSISQVNIYQDFQYIVTIFNSGGNVTNATFTQTLNPNLTIEGVANKLGYKTRRTFEKAYKISTGITPNEFKKQLVVPVAV